VVGEGASVPVGSPIAVFGEALLMIALLAVIYLIDIVATIFLIPEKKGQALE